MLTTSVTARSLDLNDGRFQIFCYEERSRFFLLAEMVEKGGSQPGDRSIETMSRQHREMIERAKLPNVHTSGMSMNHTCQVTAIHVTGARSLRGVTVGHSIDGRTIC